MNFTNGAELLECCEKENKKISEVMFEREITFLEQDPEKTKKRMQKAWSIMQSAAKKPLKENIISMGGMIGGESRKLHELRENKKNLCGEVVSKAIAYAVGVLEVNASMGLIVAAPTAGSSGVIPGVFCSLKENYGFSDDEICQALFNAAAVGYLITRNATTAGAEGTLRRNTGPVPRRGIFCNRKYFRTCLRSYRWTCRKSMPESECHGRIQRPDLCRTFYGRNQEYHPDR